MTGRDFVPSGNPALPTRSTGPSADRLDAIVRLLDARFDGLPEPRSVTVRTEPGFVHRTLAPTVCETCEGVDSTHCTGCGGRGWIERMRDRDPMAVDKVQPYGLSPDRREAERARDRQIQVLETQTRPARLVDEAAVPPFGWERARAKLYATTDMAAVDRAVEALHLANPGVSVYSNYALTFLSDRLPDPLRVPEVVPAPHVRGPVRPEAGRGVLELRDREMRAAAVAGASVAELRARFGVSKSTVYAVVNREVAA